MLELEQRVHLCRKCKREPALRAVMTPHYPVWSFGDPAGKEIIAVGQNPLDSEYESLALSSSRSIASRRNSQLHYFDDGKEVCGFFKEIERFFAYKATERMGSDKSPWEKVGFIDLVKCPTKCTWSKIRKAQQRQLIENCEEYLNEQLRSYKPRIIVAYGADVGRWFAKRLRIKYREFTSRTARLGDTEVHLVFVPQTQGPHSDPEILWVHRKLQRIHAQLVRRKLGHAEK